MEGEVLGIEPLEFPAVQPNPAAFCAAVKDDGTILLAVNPQQRRAVPRTLAGMSIQARITSSQRPPPDGLIINEAA